MSKPRKTTVEMVQNFLRRVSSQATTIAAETVAIPAGAAGSIVTFSFSTGPITNAAGSDTGGDTDTSIVLTSTTFTNEVVMGTEESALVNGDYWVDYLTGQGIGKKADTATSMTATYGVFTMLTSAGAVSAGKITIGGTTYTVKRAVANIAGGATDSTIVTAVGGKQIFVLAFIVECGGTATTFTFQSNSTAIFPVLANGVNGGAVAPRNDLGWMVTAVGEALKGTSGAGSTTGVWVAYIEV